VLKLLDELLAPEIRPHSPAIRPAENGVDSGVSPNSPNSPAALTIALPDPAAEARRQRVLAMLADNPALRLAVVCDAEGDPVPVTVAIRDKGTCEVHIPAVRFDPFALLELVERHGGTVH